MEMVNKEVKEGVMIVTYEIEITSKQIIRRNQMEILELKIIITETRVLGPKPKLKGFHMAGLAICPNMPNKERSNGEVEIYYTAWAAVGRGKVSTLTYLQPFLGIQT
jgi:hypothetical protein